MFPSYRNQSIYLLCIKSIDWRLKQSFTDVLQSRCFKKFCNIHWKKPVLEPLFNKAEGLRANVSEYIKKKPQSRCFPMNIAKFLRTFL